MAIFADTKVLRGVAITDGLIKATLHMEVHKLGLHMVKDRDSDGDTNLSILLLRGRTGSSTIYFSGTCHFINASSLSSLGSEDYSRCFCRMLHPEE